MFGAPLVLMIEGAPQLKAIMVLTSGELQPPLVDLVAEAVVAREGTEELRY